MGETICVISPICIFRPYFQPITVSLSVIASIMNTLAFIHTHVCKVQLSTVCAGGGKAVTSDFTCRANWENNMGSSLFPCSDTNKKNETNVHFWGIAHLLMILESNISMALMRGAEALMNCWVNNTIQENHPQLKRYSTAWGAHHIQKHTAPRHFFPMQSCWAISYHSLIVFEIQFDGSGLWAYRTKVPMTTIPLLLSALRTVG